MSGIRIKGAYVFDLDRPFEPSDVLVVDGVIAAVEPDLAGTGDSTLDASGMILMPGLINAHTHGNQTIERGLADRLPLDSWMVLASYGGAGARFEPHDLHVSVTVGIEEMLSTGTTSVIDCCRVDPAWFHDGIDAVMTAYVEAGMRAVVAVQYADLDFYSSIPVGMLDDAPFDHREPLALSGIMEDGEAYLDRWQGAHPLVEPAVAPSSVPRCSDRLFAASFDLARARGVPLQTHLLSAKSQVVIGNERFGGSTVAHLEELGGLEPWASYAHAIWVADEEIPALAASEAVIVHNPVSNLKLGAGLAPVPQMARAGVNIALGTDGASSNDSQNMFETLKGAALAHRVHGTSDTWPSALDVLDWCWTGGARALRKPLGRVEPGYLADLVLLQPGRLRIAPKEIVARQLVYGELGDSVDTVMADGDVVFSRGEMTQVDETELHEHAERLVERIWSGLGERLVRFDEVRPHLDRLERAVADLDVGFGRPLR